MIPGPFLRLSETSLVNEVFDLSLFSATIGATFFFAALEAISANISLGLSSLDNLSRTSAQEGDLGQEEDEEVQGVKGSQGGLGEDPEQLHPEAGRGTEAQQANSCCGKCSQGRIKGNRCPLSFFSRKSNSIVSVVL